MADVYAALGNPTIVEVVEPVDDTVTCDVGGQLRLKNGIQVLINSPSALNDIVSLYIRYPYASDFTQEDIPANTYGGFIVGKDWKLAEIRLQFVDPGTYQVTFVPDN